MIRISVFLLFTNLIIASAGLTAVAEEVTNSRPTKSIKANTTLECYARGRVEADEAVLGGGAFLGGLVGGLTLNIAGAGVAAVLSQQDYQVPPRFVAGLEGDCRQSYSMGFEERAKSQRLKGALIGGVLGSVIQVAVVVAVLYNNNYF